MRLDKYLTAAGIGSRSEVKAIMKKGRVRVNDSIIKDSSFSINENVDKVFLDNAPVLYEQYRYYMFNKPSGCVSATKDGLSLTVIDYLKGENTKDLFPVGRLDKDTEGLLLLTNDGGLAHRLLSPKKHVDKTYMAYVDKKLTEEEMALFEQGVDIGDEDLTLPAKLSFIENSERENTFLYEVVIHEGRYHQVKRMFEAFGSSVVYLRRISMGSLVLDSSLKEGMFRKLTENEIDAIRSF